MNLVLGIALFIFIIVIHEAGHTLAARACGVGVLKFSIGFGPGIVLFRTKTFPVVLTPLLIGGYVSIKSRAGGEAHEKSEGKYLEDVPYWQKMIVLSAGIAMNLLSGAIFLAILFIFYGGESVSFMHSSFLVRQFAEPWYETVITAFGVTLKLFWDMSINMFMVIPKVFQMLFQTATTLEPKAGTGMIGTYRLVTNAAEAGAPSYLFTGYLFSVLVAAFNVLPLGILDGGHMAIYTVERIFGSGLPVRIFRTAVTVVGIAFLVAALLLTLGGDIVDIWSALN